MPKYNTEIEGLALQVIYDYEPPERRSNDSPGAEGSIEILQVLLGNTNIQPIMDEDRIIKLEQEIVNYLE
jgi:hypothetical protein